MNVTLVNNGPITVQVLYVEGPSQLGSFAQTLQPGTHFLIGPAVGVYLVFESEGGRCLAVGLVTGSGSVTIS